MDKNAVVRLGDERAWVYPEGGLCFDRRVPGVGWVLDGSPSAAIVRLAVAVRAAAFPELAELTLAEVL